MNKTVAGVIAVLPFLFQDRL